MNTLEFLKKINIINEDANSFTIIKDNVEYNLIDILDEYKKDSTNRYLSLLADFENYKKRVSKEKEDISTKVKLDTLNSILELNDDFNISLKSLDENSKKNILPIINKFNLSLEKMGLKEIQTLSYDENIHEVVSVIIGQETKIVDVLSKGYTINDKIIRYPKIILSKNE